MKVRLKKIVLKKKMIKMKHCKISKLSKISRKVDYCHIFLKLSPLIILILKIEKANELIEKHNANSAKHNEINEKPFEINWN